MTRAPWSAFVAAALAIALGVLAAWPIYQTPWLLVPAAAGLVLGSGLIWASLRLNWSAPILLTIAALAFALTLLPVAVPQALLGPPAGLVPWAADALAAVVLGWKQLLTLTLPVGTYQTVVVPAYLVFFVTSLSTGWIAQRSSRFAPLAAAPLLLPVAFGTVFGAAEVSAPLRLGAVSLAAPREVALWGAAAGLGAVWVAWHAGSERRAALRLGRTERSAAVRGTATRVASAIAMLALAGLVGATFAPALSGDRVVPRDSVDPELVLAERPSPLAGYREWKNDARIDAPLFEVSGADAAGGDAAAAGGLPPRLRLAVLDHYDGVNFQVGSHAAGRFTRFPSAPQVLDPVRVSITIAEGYTDIWAPIASLGEPPQFVGPRSDLLADAFYVNRDTGAAIAVPGDPGSEGLAAGDGYAAIMSAAPGGPLTGDPVSETPLVDLESMPELAAWVRTQNQPATAAGLTELVELLRGRGYLSHAISGAESEWVTRLAEQHGTRFEPSVGGHSTARLEDLFAQLNTQQRSVGERVSEAQLVAAVGDDEQFAAAAAMLARVLGFESRVVLGVRLGEGVPGVPGCQRVCTGEHLSAWIEVRGEAGEWVPLDATPQATLPPTSLAEGEQLPEFPTTPEERDAREVDPPLGFGDRSEVADEAEQVAPPSGVWPVVRAALLAISALVLLVVPLLFLPLAKRWRASQRRREPIAELRAIGAWLELVDRAADSGVRLPHTMARSDAARVLGTDAARQIASEVDRAVFAPGQFGDADADRLWRLVEDQAAAHRAEVGFWGRLREAYALRSLGIRFRGSSVSKRDSTAEWS
ncbi:transglutaminase domain-containing protein [Leucobacter sp. W1153]|uniref:transglutaminase domain-containing protein n=1 Tax=Leucobacter sp. W1153 TaxID=3439064 RepID=UPI003F2ED0D3